MERVEKKDITYPRLYLGPMSKNIVDAIVDYNTNVENVVGMVASRRQIDHNGGYVNNWKTYEFYSYVKKKNNDVLICRDHGGPLQGKLIDDGKYSLLCDVASFDIIHIDPFKQLHIQQAIDYTADIINELSQYRKLSFEIGTEEVIFPFDEDDLYYFLTKVKKKTTENFDNVLYAVIQSGTSLKSGKNTGTYNEKRLKLMVQVCRDFNLYSKEHNGDYISPEEIKNKYHLGLSAINIAPEVANIECQIILDNINEEQKKRWFVLTLENGSWKKWFPKDYDPFQNPSEVLRVCGHYVFTNAEFNDIFNLDSVAENVKTEIYKFIKDRV